MKTQLPRWMIVSVMLASASFLNGCSAIEGIFQAGVWVGVIAIALIFGLVAGGAALLRK